MSGSSCHPLIVAMTNATVEFVFLFKLDAYPKPLNDSIF